MIDENGFETEDGVLKKYTGGDTVVNVPEGITGIGDEAFWCCDWIKEIKLPSGVTDIGEKSFLGCFSLQRIGLPEGIRLIGDCAFSNCAALKLLALPRGLKRLGKGVFYGCISLERVDIPSTLEEGAEDVFFCCNSLKEINVAEDNKRYSSVDGVLFSKDKTRLIKYPAGRTEQSYTVPKGVEVVDEGAFSGTVLLSALTLSESVTTVNSAFENCDKLKQVYIPKDVSCISSRQFRGSIGITAVDVDKENQHYSSVDGVVFSKDKTRLVLYPAGKRKSSYRVPDGVQEICESAFAYSVPLKEIILPNSLTKIGNSAFYCCTGVESLTLPDRLTQIGEKAFAQCTGLRSVNLPDGLTDIGGHAFYKCSSLGQIALPEGLGKISEGLFCCCTALSKISIAKGISEIGDWAFSHCENLTELRIPEGVKVIGPWAVGACHSLGGVHLPDSVADIDKDAFSCSDNIILHVSEDSYSQLYAIAHSLPYYLK